MNWTMPRPDEQWYVTPQIVAMLREIFPDTYGWIEDDATGADDINSHNGVWYLRATEACIINKNGQVAIANDSNYRWPIYAEDIAHVRSILNMSLA